MAKKVVTPVNPALLKWARVSGGFTLEDAANRLKVDTSTIASWESGAELPLTQLRQIAKEYQRPLAAFYLPEPPNKLDKPFNDIEFIDYRRLPESKKNKQSPASLYEQRKAEMRRDTLLEIDQWRNEITPQFELRSFPNESSIKLATRIRSVINISLEQQQKWKNNYSKAFEFWRRAIEANGVLVFQTGYEKKFSVETNEWRGVAIHYPQFPIIIVNRNDAWPARIFTLFHELAHLLRGESSLVNDNPLPGREDEIYCNSFAGNVLVPADALQKEQIVRAHTDGMNWSDEEIEKLSKQYTISREMMLRRLSDLGYTTGEFYQKKVSQYKQEFEEEIKKIPKKGKFFRQPKPEKKATNVLGELFISNIVRAYHDDYLTLLDVAENLDTRFRKISDIEQVFLQQPWPHT